MRLLYDEPRRGTAGSRVNFVHPKDAGGVLVELVEPAAGSHCLSWDFACSAGKTLASDRNGGYHTAQ